MSDIIEDMHIITPAMAMEIDLHDMETLLDNMKRAAVLPSAMAVIASNRDQLRRIARLSAELVQAVNARDWSDAR